MVSKVAVTALVLITAVPILLGYAFNLTEVTETGYKANDDLVNVTPLIKTGERYTSVAADLYSINTDFVWSAGNEAHIKPVYTTKVDKSSLAMERFDFVAGDYYSAAFKFSNYHYFYVQNNMDGSGSLSFKILRASDNATLETHANIYTWDWDLQRGTLQYTDTALNRYEITISNPADRGFQFIPVGGYSSTGYAERLSINGTSRSADFSSGYYFPYTRTMIDVGLPQKTKSILMSINLDSITASTYSFDIRLGNTDIYARLDKTTVDGVAKWSVKDYNHGNTVIDNLYYDPFKSDNTYQLYYYTDNIHFNSNDNLYHGDSHLEFRYVGSWPTLMGAANSYLTYSYDIESASAYKFDRVELKIGSYSTLTRTPTIRIDQAIFSAFAYEVIEDVNYTPSDFRTNPYTTINDPQSYGTSLTFGGNTYVVSDGKISLNGHDIPVKGLVLSSSPNDLGTYDNKIGDTVVSTTAQPSSISFNGQWSASITTQSMDSYSYTKTEWKAGSFAWDGIDKNFIMAGLLTSLGAFVGVGIYARRTKSSVWPLLIVCGGAALLFFVML